MGHRCPSGARARARGAARAGRGRRGGKGGDKLLAGKVYLVKYLDVEILYVEKDGEIAGGNVMDSAMTKEGHRR
jgi:hypothetical protein